MCNMARFLCAFLWNSALLLRLSITDIRSKELENLHIGLILLSSYGFSVNFWSRLLAASLPFLLSPLIGFGDVLLYAALGFSLGPIRLFKILIISSLLGGIFAIIILCTKKAKLKSSFAFAPFIAIAYLIVLLEEFCSMFI